MRYEHLFGFNVWIELHTRNHFRSSFHFFHTFFIFFSNKLIWFCFVSLHSNFFLQNISFFCPLWGSIPKWNIKQNKRHAKEGHKQNLWIRNICANSLLTVTYCVDYIKMSWDPFLCLHKKWIEIKKKQLRHGPNKVESKFLYFGTSNDKRQHAIQFIRQPASCSLQFSTFHHYCFSAGPVSTVLFYSKIKKKMKKKKSSSDSYTIFSFNTKSYGPFNWN